MKRSKTRCPGSGRRFLRSLTDQHYQQCRVCNGGHWSTPGGYMPAHDKHRRLIRNAAECRNCGDVIESTHVHDFRTCSCYRSGTTGIFVDGGLAYLRRGALDLDDVIERSEWE